MISPMMAEGAAAARGIPDLRSYVLRGLASGRSLKSLSTAVGLPQHWLGQHLDLVIDDRTWQQRLAGDAAPPVTHRPSRPPLRLVRLRDEPS
jgi:hypothetical protein